MALGVINHFKTKKFNIVLAISSTILTVFLCTIAFWWMIDTVVYLKYEILKSPIISGQMPASNLPIT